MRKYSALLFVVLISCLIISGGCGGSSSDPDGGAVSGSIAGTWRITSCTVTSATENFSVNYDASPVFYYTDSEEVIYIRQFDIAVAKNGTGYSIQIFDEDGNEIYLTSEEGDKAAVIWGYYDWGYYDNDAIFLDEIPLIVILSGYVFSYENNVYSFTWSYVDEEYGDSTGTIKIWLQDLSTLIFAVENKNAVENSKLTTTMKRVSK